MKMRLRGTSRLLIALLVLIAMSARGVVPRDFCLTCAKEYAQCQTAMPAAEHTCCKGRTGGCGASAGKSGKAATAECSATPLAVQCSVMAGVGNFLLPDNTKQQAVDACTLYVMASAVVNLPQADRFGMVSAESRAPGRPAYQSNCVLRI